MKKIWIFIALLPCVALSSWAQKPAKTELTRVEMSLTECVAFAQENSPLLLPVPQKLEGLEINYSAAQQAFLPSLNASVGQNFSFGRSQARDMSFTDNSSANTSFSLSADLPIFSGGQRWYQLQKAKEARQNADYIVRDVEDQIALQVTQSYIQLLLAKALATTAKDNLSLTEKSYEQIKQQVEVGRAAESDLIDIQSQLGRDQLSVTETEADVTRALRILMLDMGLDPNKVEEGELDIAEMSPEAVVANLEQAHPRLINPKWEIPATALLRSEVLLSEYDVKIAKSALWPFASYLSGATWSKAMNAPFKDQLKNNGRYFVGLSLSIPIYNRGQVRRQIRQMQLQTLNLQSQLKQAQINDDRNIILARTDLEKAEEQYRVSKENVELSKRALDVADLQFKAGRINIYEWEQVKTRHLQAKATYLQSIYTRLLRTINLTYFNTGDIATTLAEGK